MSNNWTYLSKLCFLKKLPQFFPWRNSAKFMGIHITGPAVRNHILSGMARELIDCNISINVSLSANRENRDIETPVTERSGGTNGDLREDPLREITDPKTKMKSEESEEVQRDTSREFPDWLQKSRETLVDKSTSTEPWRNPEQEGQVTSKSSLETPMEPRAKGEPGSGKHSVEKHFPQVPNFDFCLKTKKNKFFLQKTYWYSRALSGKFR